ncbi:hypothetical protein ABIA33_002577 [Streptacidiphilus sp. MAP12-16]|uniref:hypothetical protein n=1 Tax=Streptacidiphilus sp. MAP12-16 TaxID=3156300 RepID=UPI003516C423
MEDREKADRTPRRRALDLSLVQVAASALAAVAGAVLASELGVYGTIIGAAVVSIGATTGGAVFQHVFRRTGEELRSRVPVVARTPEEERAERRNDAVVAFGRPTGTPAVDATASFDPFDPGGEHTRMMAVLAPPELESVTTYRGSGGPRSRNWKTYLLATGLVFVLAMGTVTVVELVAAKPIAAIVQNEPGQGTSWGGGSVGAAHTGGTPGAGGASDATSPGTGVTTGTGGAASTDPSSTPSGLPSSSPSSSPSPGVTPDPSPSASSMPSSTATTGTTGSGNAASSSATPTP